MARIACCRRPDRLYASVEARCLPADQDPMILLEAGGRIASTAFASRFGSHGHRAADAAAPMVWYKRA